MNRELYDSAVRILQCLDARIVKKETLAVRIYRDYVALSRRFDGQTALNNKLMDNLRTLCGPWLDAAVCPLCCEIKCDPDCLANTWRWNAGLGDPTSGNESEFACIKCGQRTPFAPEPPEQAVCEDCCEVHIYTYDPDDRQKVCRYCFKPEEER